MSDQTNLPGLSGSEGWLEGYRKGYADAIYKYDDLSLRLTAIADELTKARDEVIENMQVGDTEDGPLHPLIVAVLREWYVEESDEQYDSLAAQVIASVITRHPLGSDESSTP